MVAKTLLHRFRATDAPVAEGTSAEKTSNDKEAAVVGDPAGDPASDPVDPALAAGRKGSADDSDSISSDAQAGVQGVEAMTKVWTKSSLVFAYIK